MKETRSSIILIRIAKKLRKTTGDNRYRARVEDELPSLANLIIIACTRPVRKFIFSHCRPINANGVEILQASCVPSLWLPALVLVCLTDCPLIHSHCSISQIWLGFAWGVMYCMLECVTIRLEFFKSYMLFLP